MENNGKFYMQSNISTQLKVFTCSFLREECFWHQDKIYSELLNFINILSTFIQELCKIFSIKRVIIQGGVAIAFIDFENMIKDLDGKFLSRKYYDICKIILWNSDRLCIRGVFQKLSDPSSYVCTKNARVTSVGTNVNALVTNRTP